jgi:hypothetical protein
MKKVYYPDYAPKNVSYSDWIASIHKQVAADKAKISTERDKLHLHEVNTHAVIKWDTSAALNRFRHETGRVKK